MNAPKYLAAFFAALVFILPSLTNAQIGSQPEAAFGARGLALGKIAMASPHDALSSSWNPAGIAGLEKNMVTVFYGNRLGAGAGVKFKGFIIDYALNDQLNESRFVSVTSAVALTYQF